MSLIQSIEPLRVLKPWWEQLVSRAIILGDLSIPAVSLPMRKMDGYKAKWMTHATTQIYLEDIMLSEIFLSQKDILLYDATYIRYLELVNSQRQSRMEVATGWGKGIGS